MYPSKHLGGWLSAVVVLAFCGCAGEGVRIDGSSTVYPISEIVAEDFRADHPDVNLAVGFSGTGGGFKKFIAGEIDICDASRPIKQEEMDQLDEKGIRYIELTVAYDGLAVLVNPENDWCDCLTVEQLARIWRPQERAEKWSDLNAEWPSEPIKLYGPGTDSGTYDYFTEEIVGEAKKSTTDFVPSEDDNKLVQGVSGDKYALGYFGYAYYKDNQDKLKLLGVDNGEGCVQPGLDTVSDGSYAPLSRPLFIYVRVDSLQRPEVREFVEFYLEATSQIEEVGYVEAPADVKKQNQERLAAVTPVPSA